MLPEQSLNIYCDESCHLIGDSSRVMGLGAIGCLESQKEAVVDMIHRIKDYYGYSFAEIQWSQITTNQVPMIKTLIDYFFKCPYLSFRAIIIPNKREVAQDKTVVQFDEWYYKMYYQLLVVMLDRYPRGNNIFIDRKDTQGKAKIKKLFEILSRATNGEEAVDGIVEIDSHCSDLLQVSDLFTGMLVFHKRGLSKRGNPAKVAVLNHLLTKVTVERSTPPDEKKFNLFYWEGASHVRG